MQNIHHFPKFVFVVRIYLTDQHLCQIQRKPQSIPAFSAHFTKKIAGNLAQRKQIHLRNRVCTVLFQCKIHGLIVKFNRMLNGRQTSFIGHIYHFRTPLHQLQSSRIMTISPCHHQKRIAVFIHIVCFSALIQKYFRQRPGIFGAIVRRQQLFQRRKPVNILSIDVTGQQTGNLPPLFHASFQTRAVKCKHPIRKSGIRQKMICIHIPVVTLGVTGAMLQQKPDHTQITPGTG